MTMLLHSFFDIQKVATSDHAARFTIQLNPEHPIFQGHFPGCPIAPGVCVTQVAIDLFSHYFKQEYILHKARGIKFLNIIRPNETPELDYLLTWEEIENQEYRVKAIVQHADTIFAKIDITLRKA